MRFSCTHLWLSPWRRFVGLYKSRISPCKEYSVISSFYRVIELIMGQRLSRSEKAEVLSVWTWSNQYNTDTHRPHGGAHPRPDAKKSGQKTRGFGGLRLFSHVSFDPSPSKLRVSRRSRVRRTRTQWGPIQEV